MTDRVSRIDSRAGAQAFFDRRIGQGMKPGLERITGLLEFMKSPQSDYPVIHVAGTNGKTTVSRLVTDILRAHGFRTGTFTSPHLNRLEERFSIDGAPITADAFTQAVSDIAWDVEEYERRAETGITYFELTAALAFSVFSEVAVDVAIIEVGMGGRWDATNVIDAAVAVVTGIALDHVEYLGETVAAITGEKAAIIGDRGIVVTGPLPSAAEDVVAARVDEMDARWYRCGDAFTVANKTQTVDGWTVDIAGIYTKYLNVYLPIHGRHQIDNLATAIATAEVFLGHALSVNALRTVLRATTQPGRIEVVHHRPLVIIDGAHNVQGVQGLASALRDEFPETDWQIVAGMGGERSPGEILRPLIGLADHLWATAADDRSAIDASVVASSAGSSLGCETTVVARVADAIAKAMSAAGPDGAVVVVGSLYLTGEAREILIGSGSDPANDHGRFESAIDRGAGDDDEPRAMTRHDK